MRARREVIDRVEPESAVEDERVVPGIPRRLRQGTPLESLLPQCSLVIDRRSARNPAVGGCPRKSNAHATHVCAHPWVSSNGTSLRYQRVEFFGCMSMALRTSAIASSLTAIEELRS